MIKNKYLTLNPVLTNDNNIDFDINNINGYSQDINNYKNDYANYVSKNKDLFEKLIKNSFFNCNIFNIHTTISQSIFTFHYIWIK